MEKKFIILCCENIRPEVDSILDEKTMPLVTAESFPFHHGHVSSFWESVSDLFWKQVNAGNTICILGCGCANRLDIPEEISGHSALILVAAGPMLFLPETVVQEFQRLGSFLILPGWLSRWRVNVESDKLDTITAREMYRESIKEIVLLDTGIWPGIDRDLAMFAEFTGLPARTLAVGREYLRLRLNAEYQQWVCGQEIRACRASVAAAEKRVADFSMIADLIERIVGIHDEKQVILQVLDLIVLLCMPKRAAFLPIRSGIPGPVISIPAGVDHPNTGSMILREPDGEYRIAKTRDGFVFRISYDNELIGILSVEEVSLPSAIDEYVNLAHFIVHIAGLSITIARAHDDLVLAVKTREKEITERIQAESALRESEERYRSIIENIQDVYFRNNRKNIIEMVSPSAVKMFGYPTTAEMLGMPILTLWKNPVHREEYLQAMRARNGSVHDYEAEFVRSDGTAFWVSISARLREDPQGGYGGTEGIIRDMSERKKMEVSLKNALGKLNMLSSITRHDILNQVTGLRAYLELSREDLKGTKYEAFIEKEDEAAEAIQRQIEFTKYYQDIGVNAPKWQDAGAVIGEARDQLNPAGIDVRLLISGLEIFADPLIVKVFFNLMENSLRHGEHVSQISFSFRETDTGLVIIYQDNGIGITTQEKKRLFQKGFGKHTGLGLFLSREILAITGITITENGEPGNGVQFEISVPPGGFRRQ
jgi:PAS domain S-box-containing protein